VTPRSHFPLRGQRGRARDADDHRFLVRVDFMPTSSKTDLPPQRSPRHSSPRRPGWSSPTPSCGACPAPARAARCRPSSCSSALRSVLPRRARCACTPQARSVRGGWHRGTSGSALPRTLAQKGLWNAYPLLCVLTMEGATVGGASTRSQVTLTYGLAAPRRLDLRRRWLQKCPPSPDHFSLVGAKPRFMTANTTLCIFQEEIV
jgi:hypothetical protein